MVGREAVGDGGDAEVGVWGEAGVEVAVAEEARVSVVAEEDGYVEVGEAEELGEVEHGVYVALEWEGED